MTKDYLRHVLLDIIRDTPSETLYEAAREEINRRDTEYMRQFWIRVMTGRHINAA
jgi:hypothetical protein